MVRCDDMGQGEVRCGDSVIWDMARYGVVM